MLKEIGKYKETLQSLLKNDDKVCRLLLGDNYENEDYDLDEELEKYLLPHLYVPGTINEKRSYVLFEASMPKAGHSIKTMRVTVQAICHKDIIKYKKPKGYFGYRYDVLSQYIEELLCEDEDNGRKFGIGIPLSGNVGDFLTNDYIGHVITFEMKDFR